MSGRPLTLRDHRASRVIADTYHRSDCCRDSYGACAVPVTSAERARSLRQRPVYSLGAAQGGGPSAIDQMSTNQRHIARLKIAGFLETSRDVCARAGVCPQDIDVAQFYETFTGPVLRAIEDFGCCQRGEGGCDVEGGQLERPDGKPPIETSGGDLAEAYIHSLGPMGEGVRQTRPAPTSQVENAQIGVVVAAPRAGPSRRQAGGRSPGSRQLASPLHRAWTIS